MNCLFNEPWVGVCGKPVMPNCVCCCEHALETCQVCGRQALTRCQHSGGVMCGVALCQDCGHGEMCLYHVSEGPLFIIRALLGGGPLPSIFGNLDAMKVQANQMKIAMERLKKEICFGKLTMDSFDKHYKEIKDGH